MGRDPSNGSPNGAKSVGAYYTPAPVARALTRWALRKGSDAALDPAAGDGVFLAAAAERLRRLGCRTPAVTGVELRPAAAEASRARLAAAGGDPRRVVVSDFLALAPASMAPVQAVVGNPPYVRFQRLTRAQRLRAAAIAASAGLRADPLASSWAAFVLHAERFLAPGGRLALVLPNEIGHARYARGVLELLGRRFARVTFVLFASRLFPSLDQGALLVLADDHGGAFEGFRAAQLASPEDLQAGLAGLPTQGLDARALTRGDARLHHAWLPATATAALQELRAREACAPLGSWADVSIGYVTGANAFFHLSPDRAEALGIGARHLRPALFRGRALAGLEVTARDWQLGAEHGHSGYLLLPEDDSDTAVSAYLATAGGVRERTKVRRRRPWYRVTRATPPDLALTAMSAHAPRLAVNRAGATVSNTLHAVRLRPGAPARLAPLLALAALTSLAELSAELEGHALGGGMLKLEPSEALRLLVPLPPAPDGAARRPDPATADRAFADADAALRAGDRDAARALADRALLVDAGILDGTGVEALRTAADRLRALRRGRAGSPPEPA